MKKILLFLVSLILMISFSSRTIANNSKLSINGTLRNDKNWAIEFANIALFQDSKLITGTTSDLNGNFQINYSEAGEYTLKISHLNYSEYSKPITINMGDNKLDIIILTSAKNSINEISVKADKVLHEKGVREDTFNFSKVMRDNSGNVRELLSQVPTLFVSRENDVKVEGEGNVLVLVNGRRYYETNPLNLLNPEQIKKVTVSTTPTVDIVNEGYSSVVNILLKKERKHSINGNFEYVFPNELLNNFDGAINLYKGKWRVFGGYNLYSQTNSYTVKQNIEDNASLDTVLNLADNRIDPRHRQKYFWGADLFINDKNTIGLAATLKTLHRREIFNEQRLLNSDYTSSTKGQDHIDYSNLQMSAFYQKKSMDNKRQLSLELLHSKFIRDKDANFSDFDFSTNNTDIRFDSTQLDRKSTKLKLKYKLELNNNANFIIGTDYYNENSKNEYHNYSSNHQMDYSINRTTVFMDYSYRKNKLSYWLGLGYEYNKREINTQNQSKHILYPNIGASFSFTKKLSSTLSYQKGIHHPSIYQLDPFEYISGISSISKGNSDLTDYYTHSIKISTRYRWKRNYIKVDLFHNDTKDAISSITNFTNDASQINSYENLASHTKTGVKFNLSWRPKKWLSLGTRTSFFHEIIKDKNYKKDIATADVLSYLSLYLPKDIIIFAHYYNRPDKLISNGKISNSQSFNYGVAKYFFDKKLQLCVNLLNQFFPYETTTEYKSSQFSNKSILNRDMRTIMFSAFYNFSSKKKMNEKARKRIRWENQGKEDVI